MDQQSLIKITCDIEQAYFDVSIQNGEMVLGDYHPSIVDESSGLTGMEHGMGGYPSAENLEREGWDSFGYEVAEDGKVVHIVNLTDKGYSTAAIADGIKLISPQFSRETYLDESGDVWCIKDISDDAIFAVMKDRKIDWKAFEGSPNLHCVGDESLIY